MGRIVLQMMISVDGMVSGPHGELDWIANDEPLSRAHQDKLEHAEVAVLGAGSYSEMSSYWMAAEHDEKADPVLRDIGRAMNAIRKVVYSHHDMPIEWRNAKVHVVADDKALVEDVQRLKQETEGTIIVYGGVRLARSFVQQDLPDEIHLVICPVILGAGQPLFTDLTHRTNLRVRQAVTHDSGATAMYYDV
ncbi:MAG TPA: dihydrofolate reductase family protein [Gemmatimonadaceae bacterium]|nr:dihydrofolate reductase family protein [Gemmatimonadaceae bacterium]